MPNAPRNARRPAGRRAFSLLELIAVVAIVGLIAGVAAMRWSDVAVNRVSADGYAQSLTLSLNLARRQAISQGVSAAVVLNRTSGVVTSADVVRADSGGDVVTEESLATPDGVTVTTATDRWEFNYSGSLTTPAAGGAIAVTDGATTWTLTTNALTGTVRVVQTP